MKRVCFALIIMLFFALLSPVTAKYYKRTIYKQVTPTPTPTPKKKNWWVVGGTAGSAAIGASYSGPIGWAVLGGATVLGGLGYLAYRIYYRVRYGKQDYMEKQCRYWKGRYRELEKSFKVLRKYKNQMSTIEWTKRYEKLLREQQKILEKITKYCKG